MRKPRTAQADSLCLNHGGTNMWFILSIIALLFWSGSDFYSKAGTDTEDKYSHWKIVIAVGLVMGLHGTFEWLIGGESFGLKDALVYLPVSFFYILAMVLGYIGLRYAYLTLTTPICNTSGASAIVFMIIFGVSSYNLHNKSDLLQIFAIILTVIGIILLSVAEDSEEKKANKIAKKNSLKDLITKKSALVGILLSVLYCLIDGIGTFLDTTVLDEMGTDTLMYKIVHAVSPWYADNVIAVEYNEGSANIAYEYTFFVLAIICAIYVFAIKKEKINKKLDGFKLLGGVCETAGQFAYIFALGYDSKEAAAAAIISAYCVMSIVWARIFLKEKIAKKQYAAIAIIVVGIVILGVFDA